MIPYTISRILPNSAYNENVSICCYLVSANINELINNAITYIIEYMYEFCSKEYGYDIDITSYYDFCEKWWNKQECKMDNFYIFEVNYFDNNIWNILNIKDYNDKIYEKYIKYVIDKKLAKMVKDS